MIEEILAKYSGTKERLEALKTAGYFIQEGIVDFDALIWYCCSSDVPYHCDWIDSPVPYACHGFNDGLINYVFSVAREGIKVDYGLFPEISQRIVELCPKIFCPILSEEYCCMFAYSQYEIRNGTLHIIPQFYEVPWSNSEENMYTIDLSEVIMLSILNPRMYNPETMSNVPYICCKFELPGYQGTIIDDYVDETDEDYHFLCENSTLRIFERIKKAMMFKKSVAK